MKKLFQILCLAFLQQQVDCEKLVNIALLKTPTQTGTLNYSGLWNVSNSVDGKTECTDVNYQTYSGTEVVNEPWWQLDLGSVYTVHAVHVMGRPNLPPRQLVGFRLQVGLEENNLSMVYRNNDTAYNNGDVWINITMNTRIIKIDLPNDAITNLPKNVLEPLVLCEVEVYVLTEDKIKQSSTVTTSTVYDIYGPNLAIDGKYPSVENDDPEKCNCCSISTGSVLSWWTIDFGQPRMVGGVYVTGRKDFTNQHQSKGLNIFISSNNPKQEERQFGELIWNIPNSEQGSFFQHAFQQPRLFRFLSITLPVSVSQYMTLCEIDFVNTECKRGRYGSKCNETCGHCVGGNQTCMHTDGTCPSGCTVGYDYAANRKCTTQCNRGRYGNNCNETCGHCVGGNQTCMHTDGTCPAGCAVGYDYAANRKCTTQCNRGRYGSNCNETCGHCVGGNLTCMHTDGTCPAGCVVGYDYAANRKCTTQCPSGTYGPGCNKLCGHCNGGPGMCSLTDGTCLSGQCLKGYTGPTCHEEVNILQQGPGVLSTSQSSQYAERDSSLAVDGGKGTDPEHCNCCSQTLNYELSWWQVDIGVTVPIREIVIHGRQNDDRYQQLSGFSVYLSTSGHFSDAPFITVPRSDFNVTYHVDVDGRYARYVRIQRPGVLTICEVEVFQSDTSCLKSTFSLKCIPCGHCNGGLPCDVITGQCENGCHEGYTGELCTLPVEVKSYVGLLIGSALGGAAVVLVAVGIVALLRRKRRLSLKQSRSTREYDCPKWTSDANNQNVYDILDMSDPPISEQNISPSWNCVDTNDLKKTTI